MVSRPLAWPWPAPLAVGIVAFAAVRAAMLPGLGFWDTGELQVVAPVMGTAHPTGFPTYVLLGWLVNLVLTPLGEPALRMNLFAGLCVAVAAAVTVDLVRVLTRSSVLGVLAGIGLALTPSVWAIGTRAEAHALHLALLALTLRLLVGWEAAREARGGGSSRGDRWLIAAAMVVGLAVGNHPLTVLVAAPIALYVLAVERTILRRPRFVLTCALAFALTAGLVFMELPVRAGPLRAALVYGTPQTWDGFWYIVLAEQFRGSLIDPLGNLAGKGASLTVRTIAQFGPLAILIPAGFVATALVRPRYALLSGSVLACTVFFAASYDNADIGRYYLGPILIAWTWLAILAGSIVTAVGGGHDEERSGGVLGVSQAIGPSAERRNGLDLHRVVAAVFTVVLLVPSVVAAPAVFDAVDASGETDARRWVDEALASMEPDALIISWWSYSTPLWYAQHVEGRRPDITIIDDRTRLDEGLGETTDVIDANLPTRPVYIIRDDPDEIARLAERYVLEPIGGPDARFLTRVVGRREAGA